ncbi:MAG: ribonuclease H family protein [Bacteroidota bacterium]
MAKKKKYYVVWDGHQPGVYDSWTTCQLQIKGFPNAKYKSFPSKAEADAAFNDNYFDYVGQNPKAKKKIVDPEARKAILWDSISVDAACSGNPGIMEYRGVDTQNSDELFRMGPFKKGTNNIGEFLALVHGLAYLQKLGLHDKPIYSDSKIAMGWIKRKKVNTKLQRSAVNDFLFQLIARGEKWLKTNTYKNPILKWQTEDWGEIPADFGRK